MHYQTKAFEAVMEAHGRKVNGVWLITEDNLKMIASKRDYTADPEPLLTWNQDVKPVEERENCRAKVGQDIIEVAEKAVNAGIWPTREQAIYHIISLNKIYLDRLLNQDKPVDLHFVKLHPSPYRKNWQAILIARFPRMAVMMERRKHDQNKYDYLLDASGFRAELTSLDLLAIDRTQRDSNRTLYRLVEVEHTPTWFRALKKVELKRLATLGAIEYASYFMGTVRKAMATTIRLYHQFLTLAARPCVRDVECNVLGGYRFVPAAQQSATVRRKRIWHSAIPVVVDNREPPFTAGSDGICLQESYGSLFAMRPLRPTSQNVRDWQIVPPREIQEPPEYEI